MVSEIRVFPCDNGEIQRVQLVRLDSWEELYLLKPTPSAKALDCFSDIYRLYLVPAAPWMFGHIVMFRLPEDLPVPFSQETIHDPLTAAALALRTGVSVQKDHVRFRTPEIEAFWNQLTERDCIRTVHGRLPITTIIPVGNHAGFLTETAPEARLKVNGSFFIMDPIDCRTAYDHVGAHFGLFVKNGIVEHPPLFSREALLVRRDGSVSIAQPHVQDLTVKIGSHTFVHGKNARFYTRPAHRAAPAGKQALVIVGRRVEAVCQGHTGVPCSGFIVCPDVPCAVQPGDAVTYEGMEEVLFGIQVGNSILKDGVKTDRFISRFYNIRKLWTTPYPPSLYPLDFRNARAARIALGADAEGKPMLLWAEGAAKLGHTPGVDSCGASLSDMARLCEAVGMKNAVNLDGGGSAQILVNGRRSLQLSDRKQADFSESERPVPMGLIVP